MYIGRKVKHKHIIQRAPDHFPPMSTKTLIKDQHLQILPAMPHIQNLSGENINVLIFILPNFVVNAPPLGWLLQRRQFVIRITYCSTGGAKSDLVPQKPTCGTDMCGNRLNHSVCTYISLFDVTRSVIVETRQAAFGCTARKSSRHELQQQTV